MNSTQGGGGAGDEETTLQNVKEKNRIAKSVHVNITLALSQIMENTGFTLVLLKVQSSGGGETSKISEELENQGM